MTINDCLATPTGTYQLKDKHVYYSANSSAPLEIKYALPHDGCRFEKTRLPNVFAIKKNNTPYFFIDSVGFIAKTITACEASSTNFCKLYNSEDSSYEVEFTPNSLAAAIINNFPHQTPGELSLLENANSRDFCYALSLATKNIATEMPLERFDWARAAKKITLEAEEDSEDDFEDLSEIDEFEDLDLDSEDDDMEDVDLYRLGFVNTKGSTITRANERLKTSKRSTFNMTHEEVIEVLKDMKCVQTTANHYLHRNAKAKLMQLWEQRCPFLAEFVLLNSPLMIHGLGNKEHIIKRLASHFSELTGAYTVMWTDPSLSPLSMLFNNIAGLIGEDPIIKSGLTTDQICTIVSEWNPKLESNLRPKVCLCIPSLAPRFLSNSNIRAICNLPWLKLIVGNDFVEPQLSLAPFYHIHFHTYDRFSTELISQVSGKIAFSRSHTKIISPLIIETVLRAVPLKTRLVFKAILEFYVQPDEDFKGISRQQLATVCIQKLYSSNKHAMNHQLTEFLDHKIITLDVDIIKLNFKGDVAALLVDFEGKHIFE